MKVERKTLRSQNSRLIFAVAKQLITIDLHLFYLVKPDLVAMHQTMFSFLLFWLKIRYIDTVLLNSTAFALHEVAECHNL